MKKIIFVLATVMIVIIFGCNKSAPKNNSIHGKWMLTEYYVDPGNGSGTWKNADISDPNYLEFKSNGSLESNKGVFKNYNHYDILNDSVFEFHSSTPGNSLKSKYFLTSGLLSIYPPCIEGCGFKYKTVK